MLEPSARLLDLLELLQARPLITGREIADRLEIDRRTVRRYVAALQELGIPVEGQRGVGGGYRMRPGFRLPPLMLTEDDAVAVVLGLLAAGRLGADVEDALAKIHRVLPDALRRRVEALEATLAFTEVLAAPLRCEATRRSAWRRRSAGADVCAPATARSRARRASASSARTGWSSTREGGTWPRSTTAATTCARSGSTGCPA